MSLKLNSHEVVITYYQDRCLEPTLGMSDRSVRHLTTFLSSRYRLTAFNVCYLSFLFAAVIFRLELEP